MSGGHWQYGHSILRDHLELVGTDPDVVERWPLLASVLTRLADVLYGTEQEMDYDLSGDSFISDDAAFDRAALGRILEITMKAAPDAWFPRGKWATIQAIQGRMST